MNQHRKSVMASVHNQRMFSSEKSGGMHCQIWYYLLHINYISFYQTNKKLLGSSPLVGFLAHVRAADACTELIELSFEMNNLPIGKGIGERLRKTSQDEGRYRPDKITHDEPTRVAINFFK